VCITGHLREILKSEIQRKEKTPEKFKREENNNARAKVIL